jgi:glycerophosphoryl diester phosphodiesterase
VTPTLIERAHAAGVRVHAWVVDRPALAKRLVRMGTDGLFTNAPALIRRAAEAGG